jgi:hypothetical protein
MARRAVARRRSPVFARRVGHRAKKMTISLAMVAGFAPLATNGIRDFQQGGIDLLGKGLSWRLTGWNVDSSRWDPSGFMTGLGPILLGVGVHKLANRLGINRAIAGMGIPLLRL